METDDWGKDPSVQMMRSVFNAMERSMEELMESLEISPYDQRIRRWLEMALPKFEEAWTLANRPNASMHEKTAAAVYAHCLAKVIESAGIRLPEGILPDEKMTRPLVNEVFK